MSRPDRTTFPEGPLCYSIDLVGFVLIVQKLTYMILFPTPQRTWYILLSYTISLWQADIAAWWKVKMCMERVPKLIVHHSTYFSTSAVFWTQNFQESLEQRGSPGEDVLQKHGGHRSRHGLCVVFLRMKPTKNKEMAPLQSEVTLNGAIFKPLSGDFPAEIFRFKSWSLGSCIGKWEIDCLRPAFKDHRFNIW